MRDSSRRITVVLLGLLALPVFLFVYNPALKLGGLGMLLGALGMTISPLIVLGFIVYVVIQEFKRKSGSKSA